MPRSNGGMPCAKVGMLHAFLAMLRPFLATRYPFLGMLHAFAATLCEREDAIHEESRGHRALHGMLFLVLTTPRQSRGRAVPSLGRGSECVGTPSEGETTRYAYVGMPTELLGTLLAPLE